MTKFEQLFHGLDHARLEASVNGLLHRYTVFSIEAADVVQDALVIAMQRIDSFEGDADAFQGFLFEISRRCIAKMGRRRVRLIDRWFAEDGKMFTSRQSAEEYGKPFTHKEISITEPRCVSLDECQEVNPDWTDANAEPVLPQRQAQRRVRPPARLIRVRAGVECPVSRRGKLLFDLLGDGRHDAHEMAAKFKRVLAENGLSQRYNWTEFAAFVEIER